MPHSPHPGFIICSLAKSDVVIPKILHTSIAQLFVEALKNIYIQVDSICLTRLTVYSGKNILKLSVCLEAFLFLKINKPQLTPEMLENSFFYL